MYGSGNNGSMLKKEGFNYMGNNTMSYDPDLPYGIFRYADTNQRSWGMPMSGFDDRTYRCC